MILDDIKKVSNDMVKNFVEELGYDGEYYVTTSKCPMIFGNILVPGKFYTAGSKELQHFLSRINLDEKRKEYVNSEGLIVVNKIYKEKPADADLYTTFIHEQFHSNRMLLINKQYNENEDINSVFYSNGHFEQNSNSSHPYYADASQDILKGSIDDSKQLIDKYDEMSDEKKEDISFENEVVEGKMNEQFRIDEALVETMSIAAYMKFKQPNLSIMDIVKNINAKYDGEDIHAITNIIIRHNDLELFKWMLDPLSYQLDDINYDYFEHYITSEDMQDLKDLKDSDEIVFDDDSIDEEILNSRKHY
ncbi:MAG: hypothetical protein E7157_03990 [Lactobacillales bacterium]|nr:hypothetical protein [Lactobacillales bacterium]